MYIITPLISYAKPYEEIEHYILIIIAVYVFQGAPVAKKVAAHGYRDKTR